MQHRLLIVDDFFYYPAAVRSALLRREFKDYASPWDGVTYPGICEDVPFWIGGDMFKGVAALLGIGVTWSVTFARLTHPSISAAPNKIHSDHIMGDFAAHVFLSEHWPTGSGTGFFRNLRDGSEARSTGTDLRLINPNELSDWESVLTVPGRFNRLLIHDANLWHAALPIGGFGSSLSDGRLVLTMFLKKMA